MEGSIQANANKETQKSYINLIEEVLDEKFHHLIKKSDAFDGCIYFILLIGFDEEKMHPNQNVKQKMQIHVPNRTDVLNDPLYESWYKN